MALLIVITMMHALMHSVTHCCIKCSCRWKRYQNAYNERCSLLIFRYLLMCYCEMKTVLFPFLYKLFAFLFTHVAPALCINVFFADPFRKRTMVMMVPAVFSPANNRIIPINRKMMSSLINKRAGIRQCLPVCRPVLLWIIVVSCFVFIQSGTVVYNGRRMKGNTLSDCRFLVAGLKVQKG